MLSPGVSSGGMCPRRPAQCLSKDSKEILREVEPHIAHGLPQIRSGRLPPEAHPMRPPCLHMAVFRAPYVHADHVHSKDLLPLSP